MKQKFWGFQVTYYLDGFGEKFTACLKEIYKTDLEAAENEKRVKDEFIKRCENMYKEGRLLCPLIEDQIKITLIDFELNE